MNKQFETRKRYYKMLELYKKRKSIEEIAGIYNLSITSVEIALKKAKEWKELDIRYGKHAHVMSPGTMERLVNLGHPDEESVLNWDPFTLRCYYYRRFGLTHVKEIVRYINANTGKYSYLIEYLDKYDKIPEFNCIIYAYDHGLDISVLTEYKYSSAQMDELIAGMESGIDVTTYANPKYKWCTMREIRYALEDGIEDILKYDLNLYNSKQLRSIRLGLMDELDVSEYDSPNEHWSQMEYERTNMLKNRNEESNQVVKDKRDNSLKPKDINIIMKELEASGKFSILVKPV